MHGISEATLIAEMYTAAQASARVAYVTSGYHAYSNAGVVEQMDKYIPDGRDVDGR